MLDVNRAVSGHPHRSLLQVACDFLPETNRANWKPIDRGERSGKRQAVSILAQWVLIVWPRSWFGRRAWNPIAGWRKSAAAGGRLVQAVAPGRSHHRRWASKAEVTAGGSHSPRSILLDAKQAGPGLFFAGELLDLTARSALQFQAAFTRYLAGSGGFGRTGY